MTALRFVAHCRTAARMTSFVRSRCGYQARRRTDSVDVLDRYVLAKTHDLVVETTAQMDAFDVAGACQSLREFLDVLTNWYVRRSRQRFWANMKAEAAEGRRLEIVLVSDEARQASQMWHPGALRLVVRECPRQPDFPLADADLASAHAA